MECPHCSKDVSVTWENDTTILVPDAINHFRELKEDPTWEMDDSY